MIRRGICSLVCVVLLFSSSLARAEQTVLLDRSGSMADQAKVEASLLDALVTLGARRGAFRLVLFGEHVINVPGEIVKWTVADGWQSKIGALSAVQGDQLAGRARAALSPILNAPAIVPAKVTNVPAVLVRAGRETDGALIVFDGKNEVSTPSRALTHSSFPVVLCASMGDSGESELVITQRREKEIRQWAPNAEIFACTEMEAAVKNLLSKSVQSRTRAVTLQR